jgi:hypothetical protein
VTESLKVDPELLTGYRQDQLAAAFDRVRDPQDWQAPIEAEIHEGERLVVEKAVEWFTDTSPMFLVLPEASGRLMVRARGYRLGPSSRSNRGTS